MTLSRLDCLTIPGAEIMGIDYFGDMLAFGYEKKLRLVHVSSCEVLHEISVRADVNDVAFSPDGASVSVACGNGTLKLFNVSDGEKITQIKTRAGGLRTVQCATDGTRIAAGHYEPYVSLFDSAKGKLLHTFDSKVFDDAGRTAVAFSPDNKRLVSTARDSVFIWELTEPFDDANNTIISGEDFLRFVDVVWLPDRIAALSDHDGTWTLYVWQDGKLDRKTDLDTHSTVIAAYAQHRVVVGQRGQLSVYDVGQGKIIETHTVTDDSDDPVTALAGGAERSVVYAGTESGAILTLTLM